MSAKRVDEAGRAYAGSQLQIQIYVNRRPDELSAAVRASVPELARENVQIQWASPLEDDTFAEYQDAEFLGRLGLERHAAALREFWPRGGPVWDALARVQYTERSHQAGVLLVEAKSYPGEMRSNGCQATQPALARIAASLGATRDRIGVSREADWLGPLYQSANRLAHLYFLREVVGVPAWLANVYFTDDPHSPTSLVAWQEALAEIKMELGVAGLSIPGAVDIFLPARKLSELERSTAGD